MKKMANDNHCCNYMRSNINDSNSQFCYDKELRLYYAPCVDNGAVKYQARQILWFCPWCGKKLPKDLQDEYYDILSTKYGIEWEDVATHQRKIPQEFLSDEWWKKRGL